MTPLQTLLTSPLPYAALGAAGLLTLVAGLRRRSEHERAQAAQRLSEQEREFAVTGLGAEVAHELAAARLFLKDLVAHAPLEQTDQEIGREEVARLERLLSRLRRLRRAEEPRVELPLLLMVQRALARVPQLQRKRLQLRVNVPAQTGVRAGPQELEMLLVSLLRSAVASAPRGGSVAVRVQPWAQGLLLDVEDDGPGLPGPLGDPGFQPLELLGHGGSGLDLLVAMGVARGHGWRLGWLREQGRTVLRLEVPMDDSLTLHGRSAA